MGTRLKCNVLNVSKRLFSVWNCENTENIQFKILLHSSKQRRQFFEKKFIEIWPVGLQSFTRSMLPSVFWAYVYIGQCKGYRNAPRASDRLGCAATSPSLPCTLGSTSRVARFSSKNSSSMSNLSSRWRSSLSRERSLKCTLWALRSHNNASDL